MRHYTTGWNLDPFADVALPINSVARTDAKYYAKLRRAGRCKSDPSLKATYLVSNFDCEKDNGAFHLNPVSELCTHPWRRATTQSSESDAALVEGYLLRELPAAVRRVTGWDWDEAGAEECCDDDSTTTTTTDAARRCLCLFNEHFIVKPPRWGGASLTLA